MAIEVLKITYKPSEIISGSFHKLKIIKRALSLYQSSRWPPDLKSACPLGPRKEPSYTILFSQKVPQANPLQVPQQGIYGERYPLIGHFYISLDISL
jgi:hypothetical protein